MTLESAPLEPRGLQGKGPRLLWVGAAMLALGLGACSNDAPGGDSGANPVDSNVAEVGGGDDISASDDSLPLDSAGNPDAAPLTLSLPTHAGPLAGAGTISSKSFRLHLSAGAPVTGGTAESPSFRLKLLTPQPPAGQEVP